MPSKLCAFDGLYRCTNLGETSFCEVGNDLPTCSCDGGGVFLFFPLGRENTVRSGGVDYLRVHLSPTEMIEVLHLPITEDAINALGGVSLSDGLYLVEQSRPSQNGAREERPALSLTPYGDFDPDFPAYEVIYTA